MKQGKTIQIYSFILALLLILTLFPGSVFALAEAEQGHNHTEGYCYVCKEGDPSMGLAYNVAQDIEAESPAVMIGDQAYWSLAEAVQAAAYSDTLHIQRSMELAYPIMIDKDLTLVGDYSDIEISRGFSGEAMFTVRGGATVQVGYLTFDGGSDEGYSGYSIFHVLDGSTLALSNGTTLQDSQAEYGGGVYADASSTLQLNGEAASSQITQCSADYSGGGIYSEGTVQILSGAYVTGNTAEYGGGIWTGNGSVTFGDPGAVYGNTDTYGEESNIVDASASLEEPEDPDSFDVWDDPDGEDNSVMHTVYFNPGDGTEPVSVQVGDGDILNLPEDISWEGYLFTGWTYFPYDDGVAYPYDFSLPVYSDFTIYANWEPVTDPGLQTPLQPSEFDQAWDPQYDMQTNSQQLDPQYSQQPVQQPDPQEVYYQVSFDYNVEGWDGDTQQVKAGDLAANPYDPETMPRDGYALDGWYYYTNEGEFEFDFDQPVGQNYYLTAKWTEVQPTYVTVTYDPNDGASQAFTDQVVAGTPAKEASASRDGYNFDGWYYYDEYGDYEPYNFDMAVNSDLTLYAGWTPVPEYTIYFDFNADGEIAEQTQTVRQGLTATDPYNPETMARSGWQFLGWFYTDEYGDEYQFSFDYAINSDWELYAKWTPAETEPLPEEQAPSMLRGFRLGTTNVQQIQEAPQEGGGEQSNNPTGMITGQIQPGTQEITLINQEGSPETGSVLATIGEALPTVTPPERTDYAFGGYFSEMGGAGTQYYDAAGNGILQAYPESGAKILYAYWTSAAPVTYEVTLDPNGGTAGSKTSVQAEYGIAMPALAAADLPTLSGSVFGGFYQNVEDESTKYYDANGASARDYDRTEGMTLYAKWTVLPPAVYKVVLDPNGGQTSKVSLDVTADQPMPALAPTELPVKQGSVFGGYYKDLSNEATKYYNADGTSARTYDLTEGTTLYAKWTEAPTEAVLNYHANGGEGTMEPGTGTQGSSIQVAANGFTRAGYVFASWNTMADGSGTSYAPGAIMKLEAMTNDLHAQWEVQTFVVTFDPCNGTGSILQTVPNGQKATEPAVPVPAGYRLEGWYREAAYVNKVDLANTPITGNITFFAKWEPIPVEYYSVTFSTDKGTAPTPQSVQKGQMAYKPADPYAEGFLFGGWYLDQAFSSLYNFNSPVNSNITLYAKWAPRPDLNHIVSFNANGHGNAPNPQTVKGGELAQKPEAPKAAGYTFTGWFTDAQCTRAYNFQEPVTQDITLYAGWTVNRYTIRFDSNTGAGIMQSIGVTFDQRINLPANTFTKSGFYFLGWNTQADGTGVYIADRGEVVNLTDVNGGTVDLYAQWKNIYNVIEGANAQVMKGSGKGLTFRCDGDYNKFTGIKIDGRTVPTSQYTSAPGSTVVTLHADYVDQMNTGSHTLRFEYTDGGVDTRFELLSRTPTTGDTNNTLLWIIIAVAALLIIGAVTAVLVIKRRRADSNDPYFDDFGPGDNRFSRDYDSDHDEYEDDRGDYEDYETNEDYETDEDRYERYVDDQLKHRGKRR